MKYVIIQGDGMADRPVKKLNNKTPLQVAKKDNINKILNKSIAGMVHTIPKGLPPGSDVGNLSLLGYNPDIYFTGRASIEAAAKGIELEDGDIAYRCNLVTLSDDSPAIMVDYSSGHISTEEADILLKYFDSVINSKEFIFYTGVSYRHLMIWKNGKFNIKTTPPHDISDKEIDKYLPSGEGSDKLLKLMKTSRELFPNHKINQEREENGKNPANSAWFWGQGKKPSIEPFYEKFSKSGSIISAVDLVRGLGKLMKLNVIVVDGVTGYLDTNYQGKVDAALKTLNDVDFVFIHVEAPDETGHQGREDLKVRAIEDLDKFVIGPIISELEKSNEDFRVLITPDHPTPVELKTHTSDPVPFLLYDSRDIYVNNISDYDEFNCSSTGIEINEGYKLISYLFEKENF